MVDSGTGWTDERVELLAKLWSEGLSASQIAAVLGGSVTRNAVIGKVHRLGLSGRGKTGQPAPQPRPATAAKAKPAPAVADAAPAEAPRPAATILLPTTPPHRETAAANVAIPESRRVGILDLRESMCRWPLGDPSKADFAFCGARSATGLPYCSHHCTIAYQPATERRRLRA